MPTGKEAKVKIAPVQTDQNPVGHFFSIGHPRCFRKVCTASSLACRDAGKHGFGVEPGEQELRVGGSSAEIPLKKTVNIPWQFILTLAHLGLRRKAREAGAVQDAARCWLSPCRAERLGLRQPSAAFPSDRHDCANVKPNRYIN
jgi:hypothetical protein